MKHLYNARDYFKSSMLHGYSSFSGESMGFVSESFEKAIGSRGGRNYSDALLSVATLNNSHLRLIFDAEMGCTGLACDCLKSNISLKTGLPVSRIITVAGRMSRAQALSRGDAIAHEALGGYGTLGGFVLDKDGKKPSHVVSNNHVLANSNRAAVGDSIYSKSTIPRHIGKLTNYVPIQFGGYANRLDLAAARLDSDERISADYYRNVRQPRLLEQVTKTGARTGTTYGIVQSTDETVRVDYNGRTAVFEDQISISGLTQGSSFSLQGDSGSFIFGDDGDLLGLLFSGNGIMTNANHSADVAAQLRSWNLLKR